MVRWWLAVVLVVGVGCQGRTAGDSPEPEGSTSETPPAPEYCPEGPGGWVAGRVLRPEWQQATGQVPPDAASTDPEAPVVERRAIPAPQVPVRLYRHGEETTLASGQTDAKGRWCLRVDADLGFGVDLLAEATVDETPLRRPVITREGQVISLRTEPLLRVLVDRGIALAEVPRSVYLNMEAMAATAVDLIEPVDWQPDETLASGIDRTVERLGSEERLAKKLQRLGDNGAEP